MNHTEHKKKSQRLLHVIAGLVIIATIVWYAAISENRDGILTISFLDVGQGDAIFIDGPNGTQILIDGGRDKRVLRQLGTAMPFYDRSIDVVIATHPDEDHIGGLSHVLSRYEITLFVETDNISSTPAYSALSDVLRDENPERLMAEAGMRIPLGTGAYLEVIFPDTEVGDWDANDASVVTRIVYGDTSFLLTGDAPKEIEEYLAHRYPYHLEADVLKIGHHGSRTSTSDYFLGVVDPQLAIISAAADNSFGHPHKEVLEALERFEIQTLSTAIDGDIVLASDGTRIWRK